MSFLARIARIFPANDVVDTVQTMMTFDAPLETVWAAMMFYEEIPQKPSPLLRAILPVPVRTRGEKTKPGSIIECTYDGGSLEKRITDVDVTRSVHFEVTIQALGIEDAIMMTGGLYELRGSGERTELVLTTNYRGRMRPRFLFRPLERFIAHRVHRHILIGMRTAIEAARAPAGEHALAKV